MKPLAHSACLLIAALAATAAEPGADEEIRVLKATVKLQAAQINALKAENAELHKQVAELRALCVKAGISLDTPAPPKAGAAGVTYLGKKRTAPWLESTYRRHRDKIALIEGKYVDLGEAALRRTTVGKTPATASDPYRITPAGSQVLTILSPDAVIIQRPGLRSVERDVATGGIETTIVPPLLYHVTGVDASKLTRGKFFGGKLIHVGGHEYITPKGDSATMQSFRLYTPLTREQFIDALAKGFRLYRYSRSGNEITRRPMN